MELKAQHRTILGKKTKVLRQQGLIPAELYGHGFENIHLSVLAKDFLAVFKEAGESTIVKLKIEKKEVPRESVSSPRESAFEEFNVLINDFQKNSLTDKISHIDFYSVKMDEKITAMVPLEFINESPAVKEKGGILVKAMHEIEVEALPADLPRHIEVNLNNLFDVGISIYVKDLKINKRVELLVDSETVVATVTEMIKEEEIVAPISVEEVKIEGEEKKKEKEEREEEK